MSRKSRREAGLALSELGTQLETIAETLARLRQEKLAREAARREETREEERLNLAEEAGGREEKRLRLAEQELASQQETLRKTETATVATQERPSTFETLNRYRERKGTAAAEVAASRILGARSPEDVNKQLTSMLTEIDEMDKVVKTDEKKDRTERELNQFIDSLPNETAKKRMRALMYGMDVETAREVFPLEGTTVAKRPITSDDKFWLNKIWNLQQTTDMTDREIQNQMERIGLSPMRYADLLDWMRPEAGTLGTAILPEAAEIAEPAETEEEMAAEPTVAGDIDVDGSLKQFVEQTGITTIEEVGDIQGMAAKLGITAQDLIARLQTLLGEE